jgi:hypothetical protein
VSPEALREERRIEPITVTVKQFGEISNLSKDSIYKLIRAGDIRSVVICGRRLIDMDSYRALIARTSLHTSARRGGMSGGK